MKKIFTILAAFLAYLPASAQQVRQSGNVTPGHVATWTTTGVIGDGGTPGGSSFTGSTTTNNFACAGAGGSLIDCGLSSTGTLSWTGLQNLNGGATAPTRSPGDNTTNVATTAFVGSAIGAGGTINQLAYYASTGAVLSGLATANNGVLVTSAGSVPSISSTLPAAVQGNITALGTVTAGVWNGTPITTLGTVTVGVWNGTAITGPNIATNTVANSNLSQMAANGFKGNNAGGAQNVADLTVSQSQALIGSLRQNYVITGVNFNSGNTDNSITLTPPTGYTTYSVRAIYVMNPSATLASATAQVWTGAGGTGQAVTASTAITIITAAANTNNNFQLIAATNGNSQAFNATPVFFRIGTASTGAATASVMFQVDWLF